MLKQSSGIKSENISINMFEAYFRSVNNPKSKFFTPDDDVLDFIERYENNEINIMFSELNVPITQNELFTAIKQLNTGKSAGPDMHINEFFIHGKDSLAPSLLVHFNRNF